MALISRSRKFIFIKTRKTAGTSIEIQLARYCSSSDIVTPIRPPSPGHEPRNYAFLRKRRYYNHMPASEIRGKIGRRTFDRLFKFCFERHPIDKCLSHFAMLKNSPDHQRAGTPRDWDEYVERGMFPLDHLKYTDSDGRLIVDRIYKYEELQESLNEICDRLGIPREPLLARQKAGFRDGVPSIEQVDANPRQRNIILDAFEETLKHVEYSDDSR